MNPSPYFDEAELSALLDGELSPERAEVVRAALAGDPALHARFTALEADHRCWTLAAATAQFAPTLPPLPAAPDLALASSARAPFRWLPATAAALVLLIGSQAPKYLTLSLLFTSAIHIVLLVGIVVGLAFAMRPAPLLSFGPDRLS
ncbi:MAG: anti-sigma factor family protein [Planctomycetota bacterium]